MKWKISHSRADLLMQFPVRPVWRLDLSVQQQVLFGGHVVEQDVVLHAHAKLFANVIDVGLHVSAVHLDGTIGGSEKASQERPANRILLIYRTSSEQTQVLNSSCRISQKHQGVLFYFMLCVIIGQKLQYNSNIQTVFQSFEIFSVFSFLIFMPQVAMVQIRTIQLSFLGGNIFRNQRVRGLDISLRYYSYCECMQTQRYGQGLLNFC